MKKELERKRQMDRLMTQYGTKFIALRNADAHLNNDGESSTVAHARLRMFLSALMVTGPTPISQITEENIASTVDMLSLGFSLLTENEGHQIFDNCVKIGQAFLVWLSSKGRVTLTPQKINHAFQIAKNQSELVRAFEQITENDLDHNGDFSDSMDDEDQDRKLYHYDRPELPKYRVATADRLEDATESLAREFVESSAMKPVIDRLGDELQWNLMGVLVGIVEHLYGEYRQTPVRWTKKALKGVLTGYVVKDALIPTNEYPQMEPVLKAFMDWAANRQFIFQQIAERMKRAITEVAPEMVKLGSDEDNFSEEKSNWLF